MRWDDKGQRYDRVPRLWRIMGETLDGDIVVMAPKLEAKEVKQAMEYYNSNSQTMTFWVEVEEF